MEPQAPRALSLMESHQLERIVVPKLCKEFGIPEGRAFHAWKDAGWSEEEARKNLSQVLKVLYRPQLVHIPHGAAQYSTAC